MVSLVWELVDPRSAPPVQMATAERLNQARKDAGFKSILEFQQVLPRDVRGTSYSSVRAYERGEVEPPLEFLQAAADVLGVTAEWLGTGKGHQTPGQAEAAAHRERQRKAALSDKLWKLTQEVLESYTQLPGPALRVLQDLIFDLYYTRGPEGFGVEWEGVWEGWITAVAEGPDLLIESHDVHAYLEQHLGSILYDPPVSSYGEHVAQWLANLSILYLREFGSHR